MGWSGAQPPPRTRSPLARSIRVMSQTCADELASTSTDFAYSRRHDASRGGRLERHDGRGRPRCPGPTDRSLGPVGLRGQRGPVGVAEQAGIALVRIDDAQLVLLPVRLRLATGPLGPEPSSGASGSSFASRDEHQDLPWFWSIFVPLPVTSPARAGPAPRAATAAPHAPIAESRDFRRSIRSLLGRDASMTAMSRTLRWVAMRGQKTRPNLARKRNTCTPRSRAASSSPASRTAAMSHSVGFADPPGRIKVASQGSSGGKS